MPEVFRVSVIIPTVFRDTLQRAIDSVMIQSGRDIEIELIVVGDVASEAIPHQFCSPVGMTILSTGGGKKASFARQIGVDAASGEFVAFLDDDDVWKRNKIAKQLSLLNAENSTIPTIISSRVETRRPDSTLRHIGPKALISPGQRIEDYLFRRRRPTLSRPSLYTSTLLLPTTLARSISWDSELSRHQDWDYLLQAQKKGAKVIQSNEALVEIWIDSPNSISGNSDWKSSLNWVKRWKNEWNRNTYADFLSSQVLRYATQSKSAEGVRSVFQEIWRVKKIPHFASILMGIGGVVPRGTALRLLSYKQRNNKVSK